METSKTLASQFDDVVCSLMNSGKTRQESIRIATRKYPRLHAAYLVTTNEAQGRHSAVAHLRAEHEING